jgi:hypothetical protein
MTREDGDWFNNLIYAAGLTIKTANEFFDVDERNIFRWVNGGKDIPFSVVMLLEIMIAYKITPEQATRLGAGEHDERDATV